MIQTQLCFLRPLGLILSVYSFRHCHDYVLFSFPPSFPPFLPPSLMFYLQLHTTLICQLCVWHGQLNHCFGCMFQEGQLLLADVIRLSYLEKYFWFKIKIQRC